MILKEIFNTLVKENSEKAFKNYLANGMMITAIKTAEELGKAAMANKDNNANTKLVDRLMPDVLNAYNGSNVQDIENIYNALRSGNPSDKSYDNELNKMIRDKSIELKSIKGLISKVQNLTDRNEHTQSVIELAKFMKDPSINALMKISDKIDKDGYATETLIKQRTNILTNLLQQFQIKYPSFYEELNSSF